MDQVTIGWKRRCAEVGRTWLKANGVARAFDPQQYRLTRVCTNWYIKVNAERFRSGRDPCPGLLARRNHRGGHRVPLDQTWHQRTVHGWHRQAAADNCRSTPHHTRCGNRSPNIVVHAIQHAARMPMRGEQGDRAASILDRTPWGDTETIILDT
ncbi:hypothetical protein AAFN86_26300 [Roseomonas sp. CAU 1739]|uniref:hypothetical protein n=1 Tax=Roseomonas sp. CAU 1739 TaxID=3140364 RepID=UPI00325ADBE6